MLARRDGGQRHFLVQGIGGGDIDHIDFRIVDQSAPVVRGPRETIGRAMAFRALRGTGADHLQPRAQGGVEHRAHRRHGHGMRLAHVAAAENPDADFGHAPFSF